MKTIKLKDNEYELLMGILEEAADTRSTMSCNDPYDEEEELFTPEERIEIQKSHGDDMDEEDIDGFLCNFEYPQYIIDVIKNQVEN